MHVDVRMDGDVAADPRLVPGETEVDRKWVDDAAALALGSLSRLRERVGERVSPQRDNPQEERTLTRHARDDASHRPGRVGLSRKRERREQARDLTRQWGISDDDNNNDK